MSVSTLTLQCSDGEDITVDRKAGERSILIKNMVSDLGEEAMMEAIPISNVEAAVLKKVMEWCTHHKSDPIPTDKDDSDFHKKTTDIDGWDQTFMLIDQEMVIAILLAANFLDIKALLKLASKTIANMIKGKSTEEIREIFKIKNDFTPEQEEKIRREHEWVEGSLG